jgi:hypothetical protein
MNPFFWRRKSGIPVFPCNVRGSVEHFYHFLLGYLLPLVSATAHHPANRALIVRECGPMTHHFRELNGWNFEILPKDQFERHRGSALALEPPGFDDPSRYNQAGLRASVDRLAEAFALTERSLSRNPLRILIIDRGESHPFYQSAAAELKGSGKLRRSIPNLRDLVPAFQDLATIVMVELEAMRLQEQARLFRSADIIIAQHGAALANLVWCGPGAMVIEIGDIKPTIPFFSDLSKVFELDHHKVGQTSGHAPVDLLEIRRIVESFSRIPAGSP